MADTLAMRSLAWLVGQRREALAELDMHADLEPFRRTAQQAREAGLLSPAVVEAIELLEAEIRAREMVQERARRVLSDGDAI